MASAYRALEEMAEYLQEVKDERDALREVVEDLLDRQFDYPTDLSSDPEWGKAYSRAARVLLAQDNNDRGGQD